MSVFTPQQQSAITTSGNVVVVAGAGAGKTSTLVERCVACLLDDRAPASLEEILMVTFGEPAATELRKRIRQRLADEAKRQPCNQRLEQQLALLDTAHISTLHSFCFQLVRQHFHELELDPQITVLDERQTRPMELAVLEGMLSKHYAGDGPLDRAVQSLIREQGRGSDDSIRRFVLKLHRFTQTLANPAAWMANQADRFNQTEPHQWRRWLTEGFVEWRQLWLPAVKSFEQTPNVAVCLDALAAAPAKPGLNQIRKALEAIRDADQHDWQGKKTAVRGAIKEFFRDAAFLHSLVSAEDGKDPIEEDWRWVRQPMLTLLELGQEFTAEFTRAKRELGGVDFSDLEQLALRVLRDPHTGRPTRTAETWQQKLRYVFVDEYQDINAAQDAILALLSRGEKPGNRFLVGDAKQSIYRFRLADPRIFRDYEQRWRGASGGGQRVALSDNFRSREALLEFINPLFRTLMRPAVGGVAYDPEAELRFGRPDSRAHLGFKAADEAGDNPAAPRVEFHLLPKPVVWATADEEENGNELDDLDAVEAEARLVAHRLRQMHDEKHRVWDQGREEFRPVEWRDMVVLMRSVQSRAERFAKEFGAAGVPLLAARTGFYSALEVMDLLNLLKLLDNPLQDVPLLAVLRSPLVGLSVAELAQLRLQSPAKPFWKALRHARGMSAVDPRPSLPSGANAMPGDAGQPTADTFTRVAAFLKSFDRWRRIIRQSSLTHCLETVLAETHYEALLLAEERGLERAANVRRLLDLARQYDPYQRQGLFRFLRFIQAQEQAELDLEPAAAPTENAVRLMTIHRSKGLEWPVVVVAGLGEKFNLSDLNEEILLDEEFGLCPKLRLPDSDLLYPSLAHWRAAFCAKRELLGEELRLLYVALTRARDTLVLCATAGRKSDTEPWGSSAPEAATDQDILVGRSFLDWLRLCLPQLTQPEDGLQREGQSRVLRWKIHSENEPASLTAARRADADAPPVPDGESAAEADLGELIRRVSWQYPFGLATTEPAKTSVSRLRRRLRDETEDEARAMFQVPGLKFHSRAQSGTTADRLSAAEIGTAHHTFLERVSLDRVGSVRER